MIWIPVRVLKSAQDSSSAGSYPGRQQDPDLHLRNINYRQRLRHDSRQAGSGKTGQPNPENQQRHSRRQIVDARQQAAGPVQDRQQHPDCQRRGNRRRRAEAGSRRPYRRDCRAGDDSLQAQVDPAAALHQAVASRGQQQRRSQTHSAADQAHQHRLEIIAHRPFAAMRKACTLLRSPSLATSIRNISPCIIAADAAGAP